MRDFSSRTRRLASATAVASLVVAVPATATSTAHADPAKNKVIVTGTASCERFADALVTDVSITPKGKDAKADNLSGEDEQETYSLTFTQIPKLPKGLAATATVTCVDDNGDTQTFNKNFTIKRPNIPAKPTSVTQTLNLK
ncbi:hypothetical protein [Streptomyces sp. NBC_00576]|uniref:hypothetical protein n=1 Tax=Streptomyces sp. NBC_00576 TaxID=2903665 RepID=UPI002E8123D4|nr:hypothetical protein [Streptomyces sp. NBC_00576]WUB72585.1 hypothetical protein OG734_22085 [Streptomyces sp. NBC_00576]